MEITQPKDAQQIAQDVVEAVPDSMWESIWKAVFTFIPNLGTSLLILIGFWILSRIIQRIISNVHTNRIDPDLVDFMKQGAKWGIMITGWAMALGTLGVDVSALVAGLGLTGFALGFALKDAISNTIAGIMVIIYKPFQRNDLIKVGMRQHEGRVRGIDLRYTVLECERDGEFIFIPNSMLFNNVVTVINKDDDVEEKFELKLSRLSDVGSEAVTSDE